MYGSYAPLRTPAGKMKGSFHMQVQFCLRRLYHFACASVCCHVLAYEDVANVQVKGDNGEWQSGFDAEVGVFGLDMSDATPAKW